jgi:uncharacterized protein YqhQ
VAGGVLMRGEGAWAVAVRAGDGIRVSRFALPPARRPRVLGWPVLRGVAAAADALALGLKGHAVSAGPRGSARLAAAFAAGLLVLFAAPALAAAALLPHVPAALLEGLLRIALLIGALALAARRPRLHRLLAYHGAEHKAVGCHEAGAELSPEAARLLPRVHARCGTGFLLAVTLVAAVVFVPLAGLAPPLLAATRIAAIPLVAGLAFELFRAAVRRPGRPWARAVLRPGMRLQRLTTREPDAAQLAVAVAALRAVLPPSSDERRA